MIKIGKIKLKNPVIAASGTFGYGKEFEKLCNLNLLGAIVTKTITLNARMGNPMPRICETASGMLNSIGLENEGVDNFIEEKLTYLSKVDTPIIVSISGDSPKEFGKLVSILDKQKGVAGIELNISCPNIRRYSKKKTGHGLVAQDGKATYTVVKAVRSVTKKTIITKLSPNVTDIVEIAKSACKAGSDAVSLVNTFFGMAIDVKTKRPKIGNVVGGLSGPCIKPIALKMVWDVAKNIKKPVIGMGGIMNAHDVMEFLLAGAKAVQIGTANFIDPGICEKVVKELSKHRNRYINIL